MNHPVLDQCIKQNVVIDDVAAAAAVVVVFVDVFDAVAVFVVSTKIFV